MAMEGWDEQFPNSAKEKGSGIKICKIAKENDLEQQFANSKCWETTSYIFCKKWSGMTIYIFAKNDPKQQFSTFVKMIWTDNLLIANDDHLDDKRWSSHHYMAIICFAQQYMCTRSSICNFVCLTGLKTITVVIIIKGKVEMSIVDVKYYTLMHILPTCGSVSAGQEFWLFYVFFFNSQPLCDQTWRGSATFSIGVCLLYRNLETLCF